MRKKTNKPKNLKNAKINTTSNNEYKVNINS